MELRDLVHLLYTARSRFTTIQVTWSYRYDDGVMQTIVQKWLAQQPAGSAGILQGKTEHQTAPTTQIRHRLWWQKPNCWRDENQMPTNETMVTILCDGNWWAFSSGHGTLFTNVLPLQQWTKPGIREVRQGTAPTVEERIADMPLVDPAFLLASHDLQPLALVNHAGREAVLVRGAYQKGRQSIHDAIFWTTAGAYEFLVDVERGILLRYAAKLDGQEFAVAEVEHVTFDEPIPQAMFTFST